MTDSLSLPPDDHDPEQSWDQLRQLEEDLSQRELELVTARAELDAFSREYDQRVGIRWKILTQLEHQIQEYTRYLELMTSFKPSATLKQLYRQLAKRIHPDLALDGSARQRRQQWMIKANQAYEAGDERRLQELLDRWEQSPDSVQGQGADWDRIRFQRQVAQIQERLQRIQQEFANLEKQDTFKLKQQAQTFQQKGRDFLAEMASMVDEQIADAASQINHLKATLGLK